MTSYSQPRRVNFVSVFLLLCVLAGGYAAWKFVPVYWQARKVDEALDETVAEAADFSIRNEDVRQKQGEKILNEAVARLHEMGIEDHAEQPLEVWWGDNYDTIHAKYRVIVEHPAILKPTVLTMERVRKVLKR